MSDVIGEGRTNEQFVSRETWVRLLLVEDDPLWQESLSRSLTESGYDFDLAGDGLVALNLMSTQAYGLVLLDAMLPWLDGFQVLDRMRESPEHSSIPVILLCPKPADESFTYWGGDPVKLTMRKDTVDDLVPLMKEVRGLLGLGQGTVAADSDAAGTSQRLKSRLQKAKPTSVG